MKFSATHLFKIKIPMSLKLTFACVLQVELFKRRFPHHDLIAHPERGTVLFQHDAKTTYSPEELLAMILQGW